MWLVMSAGQCLIFLLSIVSGRTWFANTLRPALLKLVQGKSWNHLAYPFESTGSGLLLR